VKLSNIKKLLLNKNFVFYAVSTLAMVGMIWFGVSTELEVGHDARPGATFPRARVVEVIEDATEFDHHGLRRGHQYLRLEILSGEYRGEVVEIRNTLTRHDPTHAHEGQRIIIMLNPSEDGVIQPAVVQTYDRTFPIYIAIILFLGLLVLVGGKSGLRSGFGLIFTLVTLLFLLIPAIVRGAPPALMTILLSFAIIIVSQLAVMGLEKKAYISIVGTSIGIACYVLFYFIIGGMLHISGFNVEGLVELLHVPFQTPIGLSQILFCSILIASLGAIMDISVSVASTTAEISVADPKADANKLFRSGMRMARDCVGASANTLILAFTGTFFIALIIHWINHHHFNYVFSSAAIGIEVLRAISASSAMVLVGPATVFIAAHVYGDKTNKKKK